VPGAGGAAPLAYAAVTDNVSSDPTYYAAVVASPVLFVPGIAAITGLHNAKFRSELAIANATGEPATVTVSFLEHDHDNGSAKSTTLLLAPRETVYADDALDALFGKAGTYGALRVTADGTPGVAVFERILTDAGSGGGGTVGQQVDSLSAESLFASGTLLGLRNDAAFRTNVGLLNAGPGGAPVTLTLKRSPDVVLGTAALFLPPFGYTQRNLTVFFPNASIPEGETLSLSVEGGPSVFGFASVIDNVSQDPTFYPELP
jgi:hypothetical protein